MLQRPTTAAGHLLLTKKQTEGPKPAVPPTATRTDTFYPSYLVSIRLMALTKPTCDRVPMSIVYTVLLNAEINRVLTVSFTGDDLGLYPLQTAK